MLSSEIFRAMCPEPGCDDGTGQPYGTKFNFAAREDAAANLAQHWASAHADAHVVKTTIPAEFH